jgi:hypothetical protein
MKKVFFTSIFFENFSSASTYLNFFKITSLETASLNLQKSKKEFYIKLYTKLKKEQKKDNTVFTTVFQANTLEKKNLFHNTFYFVPLKKKHLSFLKSIDNKNLFNLTNFSAYESVKHNGYNARYNKILSFGTDKLSESKIQAYKEKKV